jgi:hypothetical protein
MNMEDIPIQPGERAVRIENVEPPEYLRPLIETNDNDDDSISSDGPGSSSRVFSYSVNLKTNSRTNNEEINYDVNNIPSLSPENENIVSEEEYDDIPDLISESSDEDDLPDLISESSDEDDDDDNDKGIDWSNIHHRFYGNKSSNLSFKQDILNRLDSYKMNPRLNNNIETTEEIEEDNESLPSLESEIESEDDNKDNSIIENEMNKSNYNNDNEDSDGGCAILVTDVNNNETDIKQESKRIKLTEQSLVLYMTNNLNTKSFAFIDSGCSKTSFKGRERFIKCYKIDRKMQSANGIIEIKFCGDVGPLKNCYWIPTLSDDLISMADLVKIGIIINTKLNGTLEGRYKNRLIFKIPMIHNTWRMETTAFLNKLNVVSKFRNEGEITDNIRMLKTTDHKFDLLTKEDYDMIKILELYHRRLFHRGKTVIIRDLNSNLITCKEIQKVKLNVSKHIENMLCNSCEMAKSKLIPRKSKKVKFTSKLIDEHHKFPAGIISTDICGPYTVESWRKRFIYNQTFMVMDSKRCFVYGCNLKSDALKNVKHVEKFELKPRRILFNKYHSDNAKELQSNNIKEFLSEVGAQITSSTAYTPKENSHIERHFRNEDEAVSAALFYARFIPQSFWFLCKEAYNYVYNMMPANTAKGFISPEQYDNGLIPDISHLRVWGCKCWAHIHSEKRSKNFDTKALIGHLVGYSTFQRSAYKIFVPEMGKIIISRDVRFDEAIPQGPVDEKVKEYFREIMTFKNVFNNESKNIEDFEYLIGNIYYDPDEDLECNCIVTRIEETRDRNHFIVAWFKRIINGVAEEQEFDFTHVSEVEKMMGVYLNFNEENNEIIALATSSKNKRAKFGNPKSSAVDGNRSEMEDIRSENRMAIVCDKDIVVVGDGEVATTSALNGDVAKVGKTHSRGRSTIDDKRSPDRKNGVCEQISLPRNPEIDNQIAPGLLKLLDLNQKNLDYEDVCMNLASNIEDPKTFEEAMSRPKEEAQEWLKATLMECDNLRRRGVLREVALPPGRDIRKMDTKMVYKTKIKDGIIDKRKARLVARGFSQQIYEDYNETFAPVARMNSLKIFLKISLDLEHERMVIDFTAAYLYGRINEELYIDPPAGWKCEKGNVLKVEKALYGTKQAGRSWYEQIKDFLINVIGLIMCKSDTCIFRSKDSNLMIILYVDDAIVSYKLRKEYDDFMKTIQDKYEIGEEGPLNWYLGAKIFDYGNRIFMSQKDYIEKLIAKYKINGTASTPMIREYAIIKNKSDELNEKFDIKSKIGSLMYAAINTRPDICQAVSYIARFTNHPSNLVCEAITRIFKYLNGSKEFGINLKKGESKLQVYVDADLGGDINDGKSTSGGLEEIDGCIINWWSTKQTLDTAQSSCDAEVISLNHSSKNVIWTRGLLSELGKEQKDPTIIYCDNESAIKLVHNPVFHQRTKHLRLKLGLIIDQVEQNISRVLFVKSGDNKSDIFTKSQDYKRFIDNRKDLDLENKQT